MITIYYFMTGLLKTTLRLFKDYFKTIQYYFKTIINLFSVYFKITSKTTQISPQDNLALLSLALLDSSLVFPFFYCILANISRTQIIFGQQCFGATICLDIELFFESIFCCFQHFRGPTFLGLKIP